MRRAYFVFLLIAFSFGPALVTQGQDDASPSLGDVARQARLAKQQKDAPPENAAAAQAVGSTTSSAAISNHSPAEVMPNSMSTAQNQAGASPSAKNSKTAKTRRKVLTNEDVGGAHPTADFTSESKPDSAGPTTSDEANERNPPDYWASKILTQKNSIASLKSDIDQLSASIQYAPGNCVEGCVQWNEQQQQKQQQVDTMKAQLEEQQKQLEEMQESARKQGYGSSVYDP